MATAHDKYVSYRFSGSVLTVRRFVGLTLAVLASVAIGMPSPYLKIWRLVS